MKIVTRDKIGRLIGYNGKKVVEDKRDRQRYGLPVGMNMLDWVMRLIQTEMMQLYTVTDELIERRVETSERYRMKMMVESADRVRRTILEVELDKLEEDDRSRVVERCVELEMLIDEKVLCSASRHCAASSTH